MSFITHYHPLNELLKMCILLAASPRNTYLLPYDLHLTMSPGILNLKSLTLQGPLDLSGCLYHGKQNSGTLQRMLFLGRKQCSQQMPFLDLQ